jgi:large subunit ribosomal protein L17
MFRNMVTSLLKHDRIKTTDAKAKELRRWADHIVTLAKRGDLHARRMAMSIVREKDVVHKLFEEAPERFGSINGGYTRIVKIGRRAGDAAAMTLVEMVSSDDVRPKAAKPKQRKASQPPAVATEAKPAAAVEAQDETAETTEAAADAQAKTAADSEAPAAESEAPAVQAADTDAAEDAASPEEGADTEAKPAAKTD